MSKKITVIGDGGWGTALARVLDSNGHDVTVWGPFEDYLAEVRTQRVNSRYLAGITLPESLTWSADREAVSDADFMVIATPSKFYRPVLESFQPFFHKTTRCISVTKGINDSEPICMTQLADSILGTQTTALSGPSHAEEVARDVPTAVVVANKDLSVAEEWQQLFNSNTFRVYTSDDVLGIQLGGALKNIIAIAVGACDGLGFGDNTKAALITRGLAEISRLGITLGAQPETFAGLSGMGDLIVTCMSEHSRNRSVGYRLGRGESVQQIMDSMVQVAEGVWNCKPAQALAQKHAIEVPVINEVCAVLFEGKQPLEAVTDLLNRTPRPEHDKHL